MTVEASGRREPPPQSPFLCIDAGQHTAAIKRIDCDAAEQLIATVADDKTVRLWAAVPDLRLVRVLRPPIGPDDEGKLFAVAVAPDGRTVVAGGWTGALWDGTFCLYRFDPGTGRMLGRLTGLEGPVLQCVFSPDGSLLAATLGQDAGLRVWRTADWTLVVEDRDYGGESYGAAFDRTGALATACYDGLIRLYPDPGRHPAQPPVVAEAPHGAQPFGIAFTPAGDRLAVGYADGNAVSVLGAARLGELYAADVGGLAAGDLASVAWSADGRSLFAGGRATLGEGSYPIRRWSESGRGAHTDFPAAGNTLMHLRRFGSGGVLFCAGGPSFGALGAEGRATLGHGPATPDLRASLGAGFGVSNTGSTVRFSIDPLAGRSMIFDIPARRATETEAPDPALTAPLVRVAGLRVAGWKDGLAPTLNGRPLTLGPSEICRSLAITPDHAGVVLGSEWSLRLFDADGRLRWQRPAPGVVWGVNISGDGRLVVAACDDGTLRWYRLADGEEVLALFQHRVDPGWVLWTPDGQYDASPGSELWIGWHFNRGPDEAADFFRVDRLRDRFQRPEAIDRVFAPGRPAETLRGLLPPVVTILAPRDGEAAPGKPVTLTFDLRSPSGAPVIWLRTLADGQPLSAAPVPVPTPDQAGVYKLTVTAPDGARELGLLAETASAVSEVARLSLQGVPPFTGLPVVTGIAKPVLYVLVAGANGYVGGENTLRYAIKDSEDFAAAMGRQVGGLYRDVQVRRVNHGAITREDVLAGLEWLRRAPTSQDVSIAFLAGHGINDIDGLYYFLPETGDVRRLRATAVGGTDLVQMLGTTPGKRLCFLDTCNAGNMLSGTQAMPRAFVNLDRLVMQLGSAENGVVVFASSAPVQDSYESPAWANGAFTQSVLEGIDGGAADATLDRGITVNELGFYVMRRVRELTRGVQSPTVLRPHTIRDFPFVLSMPVPGIEA